MTDQKHFSLGLLFLIAIAVLGYFTLFHTDFRLFSEVHSMTVHFPEASGLRKGDAVLVAGIRQGKVASLAYDPSAPASRRVTVNLALDQPVDLRADHSIQIAAATLLGGHQVLVDPGQAEGNFLAASTDWQGEIAVDALAGLSELVTDNRQRIDRILDNVEQATGDLSVLLEGVSSGQGLLGRVITDSQLADESVNAVRSVSATFTNLEALSSGVIAGEGVIGKLFTDEDLVRATQNLAINMDQMVQELQGITSELAQGKGTLGLLLKDEASSTNVADSLAEMRGIISRINSGHGTLGGLIADDELLRNLTSVSSGLAAGEGTVGKLLSNEEIYTKLNGVSDNVLAILTDVRAGRGTVGRLLAQDDLYRDLKRALSIVTRSLEEYREVAPITSFSQVLFGAF